MNWKGLGESVANNAPLLGTLLGGPAGGAVGSLIASVFGTENKPDQIAAAIKADPNAAVKLREIEINHKTELERLALEQTKAEIADKQDARKNHKDSVMPAVLSVVLTCLIALIVYLLFYSPVPEGTESVLWMLLGAVAREWAGSMQYWFGTTRSSAEKNKLLGGKS